MLHARGVCSGRCAAPLLATVGCSHACCCFLLLFACQGTRPLPPSSLHSPHPLILPAACPPAPQVKNVSGRLMVGLRWWNEVSESGGSDWKFESLEEGQRAVNKKDSFVFWTLLYATPAVW